MNEGGVLTCSDSLIFSKSTSRDLLCCSWAIFRSNRKHTCNNFSGNGRLSKKKKKSQIYDLSLWDSWATKFKSFMIFINNWLKCFSTLELLSHVDHGPPIISMGSTVFFHFHNININSQNVSGVTRNL